jgi:hypothetical protein
MKRFLCFLTATWLLAGCSSPGGKGGPVSADTAMRSIDSSQMINNNTPPAQRQHGHHGNAIVFRMWCKSPKQPFGKLRVTSSLSVL